MMTLRPYRSIALILALAALGVGGAVSAQNDGSSGPSFEVGGIDVDVVGKTSQDARLGGWRIAQRKGWQMLAKRFGSSSQLSDGALDSVVSAVVIENEQLGGNRYIARLGIEFNRARAAAILGISGGESRSAPMLVVPLMWSGGAPHVFEQRTPWQDAWARYRTGNSTIDYVRPAGTGPDAVLLNAGQVLRPGRAWWRNVLAQYGASNVLVPVVYVYRQWPGGPIVATFQAHYGPDYRLLTTFSLRVADSDALPALLDAGIKRIDDAYQRALAANLLGGDPGLNFHAAAAPAAEAAIDDSSMAEPGAAEEHGATITVQVETPSAGAITSAEASLRGVPGVHSVVTSSLALGAISVIRVGYDGDANGLGAALEARGWQVVRGNGAIRIQRAGPAADDKTGG
jgi:hypothetical protein